MPFEKKNEDGLLRPHCGAPSTQIPYMHESEERLIIVFGPLLTEPHLHKRGKFYSCKRYENCITNKMYYMLFLCIQQMNGCEPLISEHRNSIVGGSVV